MISLRLLIHVGDLVPSVDLNTFVETFTESQLWWIEGQFNSNRQVHAAIMGPAGTGKSYLLKGLIELGTEVGVAAHEVLPSTISIPLILIAIPLWTT